MALQKDYYQPRYEITIQNCYWKIAIDDGITGGKEKLSVRMLCYKNKDVADTNSGEYTGYSFEFIPDMGSELNFIAQAYNQAKTLPEFSGALDV
jgi:hypothetical protein